MHTRICDGPLEWNSSNVAVMSQANREGHWLIWLMTHLPSCQRPQAKKAPRILWLSSPSIYLSAHPSIHSYESISLSESPGFVWYLSVSLYTTKAHSSSCQDSVVSSLNVRVGITQSALFVIKVMGNGYIGVSAENRIFFIFSLANTAGTYVCLEKIHVYSVHLNYYVTVVFICASFRLKRQLMTAFCPISWWPITLPQSIWGLLNPTGPSNPCLICQTTPLTLSMPAANISLTTIHSRLQKPD